VFLKVGENTKGGDRGAKKHQRGANAQLLIDHWVNFGTLLLTLARFLQILSYYDNRWKLLLKQLSVEFLLWVVCVPRYSVGYFRAPELSFSMAQAPAPALAFVRFHTFIF